MTQHWLNQTYGSVAGWVPLDEDNMTGWNTIYGLRRGLQHELGISPVASGFGDQTKAAYVAKIEKITETSKTSVNVLRLLSGALWCKGYAGETSFSVTPAFSHMAASVTEIRQLLGLGSGTPDVDVKLMAFLMSMDSPTLLSAYGGVTAVRTIQQWLNGQYVDRAGFPLCPADGVFSRQMLTEFLYAIQYEIGMDDETANGNYGPGTRTGLRNQAQVAVGDVDETHHFVRLLQGLLRCNGYQSIAFNGMFDSYTATNVAKFQSFMEMEVTSRGDYSTWCGLLVSCGDTDLDCSAFDTSTQLDVASASALRSAPFIMGGRYLVNRGSNITAGDLDGMRTAGLKLVPIFQRYSDRISDFSLDTGRAHGLEALERVRTLDLPEDALVFFAVDLDPTTDEMGYIRDYFTGIDEVVARALTHGIRIGAYGTRAVCLALEDAQLSEASYVAGASWGYSGNMGYRMPSNWHYNQIEVDVVRAGVAVDRVRVSKRAAPVDLSGVATPPVILGWPNTVQTRDVFRTGFDPVYEWISRAETRCEQFTVPDHTKVVPDYAAHYLRESRYWSLIDNPESGAVWRVYTPYPAAAYPDDVDSSIRSAEAANCAYALRQWDGTYFTPPDVPFAMREGAESELGLDLPHFAATFLGYRNWGTALSEGEYGIGDLGGWGLDLISAWGQYIDNGGSANDTAALRTWTAANVGVSGDTKFSRRDVIADADAYLAAVRLTRDTSRMSDALRSLNTKTPAQRVSQFYAERFGSSPARVASAFTELLTNLTVGGTRIPGLVRDLAYKAAGRAGTLPTGPRIGILADGYARVLEVLPD
jgi:peptidoglycan hydrolase-like protein with peptidoglycan-binding domain